jgi:hypothetical protein
LCFALSVFAAGAAAADSAEGPSWRISVEGGVGGFGDGVDRQRYFGLGPCVGLGIEKPEVMPNRDLIFQIAFSSAFLDKPRFDADYFFPAVSSTPSRVLSGGVGVRMHPPEPGVCPYLELGVGGAYVIEGRITYAIGPGYEYSIEENHVGIPSAWVSSGLDVPVRGSWRAYVQGRAVLLLAVRVADFQLTSGLRIPLGRRRPRDSVLDW